MYYAGMLPCILIVYYHKMFYNKYQFLFYNNKIILISYFVINKTKMNNNYRLTFVDFRIKSTTEIHFMGSERIHKMKIAFTIMLSG
jgi:hypothetical protein